MSLFCLRDSFFRLFFKIVSTAFLIWFYVLVISAGIFFSLTSVERCDSWSSLEENTWFFVRRLLDQRHLQPELFKLWLNRQCVSVIKLSSQCYANAHGCSLVQAIQLCQTPFMHTNNGNVTKKTLETTLALLSRTVKTAVSSLAVKRSLVHTRRNYRNQNF